MKKCFDRCFVSLSFDDGFESAYTNAMPILDLFSFKATFYVLTGLLSKQFISIKTLNLDQLREIYQNGHEIGSHSRTHPYLFLSLKNKIRDQVVGSKQDLESLGINVSTFGYPYGFHRKYLVDKIKYAGYIGGRAYKPFSRNNFPGDNPFTLRTVPVIRTTSVEYIKAKIDKAVLEKSWLILTFHDVSGDPIIYGARPGVLKEICKYLHEKNIEVIPIKDGIHRMNS